MQQDLAFRDELLGGIYNSNWCMWLLCEGYQPHCLNWFSCHLLQVASWYLCWKKTSCLPIVGGKITGEEKADLDGNQTLLNALWS